MRRICQVGLLVLLVLVGCKRNKPSPREIEPDGGDNTGQVPRNGKGDKDRPGDGGKAPPVVRVSEPVVPTLPEPTKQLRYELALHEAVDFLADRKHALALAALEKARTYVQTDLVRREIDRVRAAVARLSAAEKAVQDVKAVLEDGKPSDAAKLAAQALAQHGGGDRGEDLARLEQQAEALLTAEANAGRQAKLKADGAAALADKNYRSGVVLLESALALGADEGVARQLEVTRAKLKTYDDNRALAGALRKDPTRLEESLSYLRKAASAWETPVVRQEIDEHQFILEMRKDRLGVADFEVRGEVGAPAAGRTVAEALLGHFAPRFALVERQQVNQLLDELGLQTGDLAETVRPVGGREVSRLGRVRYLVVGSVTPLAGLTVQARLVEVGTGSVVQTARVSAPNMEALVPVLKQVAVMLQMTDEQRVAFEEKLSASAAEVRPADDKPLDTIPAPPVPDARQTPLVTWTPRPAPAGALTITDLEGLSPAGQGQSAAGLLPRKDPRRGRLLRLALEVGDDLFRRARYQEAQRHFVLALALAGPRQEVSGRVEACRDMLPPSDLGPARKPRLAVLGFLGEGDARRASRAAGEWAADHFASWCGDYELIDRGEASWYMARLGVSLGDVLKVPAARASLALALDARCFVVGALRQTGSFLVTAHLIDAETGGRLGVGKIHVRDLTELKLRMAELVRQVEAGPAQQKRLQAESEAVEKALREARAALVANDQDKAAEAARAALKSAPDSVALQGVFLEAQRGQKAAAFEAARRKEAAGWKRAEEAWAARQEKLDKAAEEARRRAEEEAKNSTPAVRKEQRERCERAARLLRTQAREPLTKGDSDRAVRFLQGAVALEPDAATFRELAEARAVAEKEARQREGKVRETFERARRARWASALKRVEKEKEARDNAEARRREARAARELTLHDKLIRQGKELLGKRDYESALAAGQSARRIRASAESSRLIDEAEDGLVRAEIERQKGEARRKLQEWRKKREEAERQAKRNRENWLAAMKKGKEALAAKRYKEAVGRYEEAVKLFRTDSALTGLRRAKELSDQEQAILIARQRREEELKRLKALLADGQNALEAKEYRRAIDLFRQVDRLAPGNVEALTGLSRAEYEVGRQREEQARRTAFAALMKSGKAKLSANQFKEAAGLFGQALALYPADAEAKSLREKALARAGGKPGLPREEDYQLAMAAGRAALKKFNYLGAVNSFTEALRIRKGDAAAATELAYSVAMNQGETAMGLKKADEAYKAFDRALRARPGDPTGIKRKADAEKLVRAADPKLKAKQEAFDKAMASARAAMTATKYGEALKAFERALGVFPADPEAKKGRAEAERLLGAEQERARRKASYDGAMKQGETAVSAKRYADAAKAFAAALSAIPGDPAATRRKADAEKLLRDAKAGYDKAMKQAASLMKGKKYEEAYKAFDHALQAIPGDAAAIKGKQEADEKRRKKPTDPRERQREEDFKLAMSAGQAAIKAKNHAGAVNAFKEAVRLKPEDKAAASALAAAQKLVEADQAAHEKLLQQAEALQKQRKYPDAVKAYQNALKAMTSDPKKPGTNAQLFKAWMGVGRCEHAQKRYAAAVKAYEEALKRMPNQPDAKAALQRAKAGKP
jgi:tetratricopeptide (TPR) repeat protein